MNEMDVDKIASRRYRNDWLSIFDSISHQLISAGRRTLRYTIQKTEIASAAEGVI